MSSSVVKKHEWSKWILWGSGWQTSYEGNATCTVARADGADTASIALSASFWSIGGDTSDWTLWLRYKLDNGSWSSWLSTTMSGPHYAYVTHTGTINTTVTGLPTSSGTIYTEVQLTINTYQSYSGGASSVWSENFTYSNKGCSEISDVGTITWATDMTTIVTVGVRNYLTSAQIGSYEFSVYQYDYSTTTPVYTRTITGVVPSFTYQITDTAKIASVLTACWNNAYPVLNYTLATYDPNGKLIGRSWFEGKSQVSPIVNPSVNPITVGYYNKYLNVSPRLALTGTTFSFTLGATGAEEYSKLTSYKYSIINNSTGKSVFDSDTIALSNVTSLSTTITPKYTLTAGTYTVAVTVTDARSYTKDQTSPTFTVYNYSIPQPKISVNCNGTTANITASWTTSNVNNQNDPKFSVTWKKKSDSSTGTLITNLSVLDSSVTSPGYVGYHTFSQTFEDLESETYEFILTMNDLQVGVYTTTPTATAASGFICMSALRGGNGVRFFGEAQASDAGWVNVQGNVQATGQYQSGHANGYMVNVPKDNNITVQSYFCTGGATDNIARGLWDNTNDGIATRANWWCYLSSSGNINIGNYENRANRNIYLNSNKIYGYVDGTTYRMDWIYTTAAVNGWTCRKHVNGIWECTRDVSVTGAFTTAYGSMYSLVMDAVEWPATLTSTSQVLSCTLTRVDTNGNNYCWVGDANGVKTNKTQDWLVYKAIQDTTSRTYTFRIHAILIYGSNEEEE